MAEPAPGDDLHGPQILPAHIEDTISAIARLHADHERSASGLQRAVSALTRVLARPVFVGQLTLVVLAWVGLNLLLAAAGRPAPDPPPFYYLQDALCLGAVYMTGLILASQRHDDVLASLREQLTLELAILNEQKSAKVIALIEELRRDHPGLRDRIDLEAAAMSRPADPEAVLEALKERAAAPEVPGAEGEEDEEQLDLFELAGPAPEAAPVLS